MKPSTFHWAIMSGLVIGALFLCQATAPSQAPGTKPIRVGLSALLFDEQSREQMLEQMKPFTQRVEKQVGVQSEFVIVDSLDALAKQLNDRVIQIAVLSGLHYGWVKPLCPEMKPMLTTAVEGGRLKSVVLVKKDAAFASLDQLRGQSLALPNRTQHFVRFFLEQETKQPMGDFFKVAPQRNVDDAIEAVIAGKVQAAALSESALQVFQERKPARYQRLKILVESEPFPAPVVVFLDKNADRERIDKFSEALLKADDSTEGKQMLTLWRFNGFVRLPADFESQVNHIVQKYPSRMK